MRLSLTARISLSITVVGLIVLGAYAYVVDRLIASELADQSDLQLLSHLSDLRIDLSALTGGTAALQAMLDRDARRLHIATLLTDEGGQPVARSNPAPVAPFSPLAPRLDGVELPASPQPMQLRQLRRRARDAFSRGPGRGSPRYRTLQASIALKPTPIGLPPYLLVQLELESNKTEEIRAAEWPRITAALLGAAALAAVLGALLARSVLSDVRRMGITAARISADALDDRLALDQVPQELEASAKAFNRMLDRLQAAFERLSDFSAEVAHDLRTPLGNLLGEAQVALSRARTAEEYRSVLESAVEEYERMSRMITAMLFLARMDHQGTSLERHPVPLAALVSRVISYFEGVAEERAVQLVGNEVDEEICIDADETLATRALSNLVSNALRFSPSGAVVRIAYRRTGASVALSVTNHGPSIPPQHLERVFERFFRVDPARQDSSSGSGLGLAIVRSIMTLHGGSADATSDAEATTFTLHFPGH